jgi:cell division protein ZipA
MDAATLRLILAVVGAVFLIGLYLWEKQRGESRPKRRRPPPRRTKHEPKLGGFTEGEREAAGYPLPGDLTAVGMSSGASDVGNADRPSAEPMDGPAAGSAAPTDELLIQLYITSSGDAFAGDEIQSAAERCKLHPGDMDIFHRTRGDVPGGEPLFSMANLVKPGTFPFDDMSDFTTPGLAVFAQFRGEPSDLMVFDEMLDATRVMAELLGGDIRGPRREPIREADAKALRARIRALLHGSAEGSETP